MRELQQLETKVKRLEEEIKGLKKAQALINSGMIELGNQVFKGKGADHGQEKRRQED